GAWRGSVLFSTGAFLAEGAYYDAGGVRAPFGRAFRTSLLDLEAVTLSTGLNTAIKRITGRCRPRAFRAGRCTDQAADHDAFPSGHTAPLAALAGAHLVLAIGTPSDSAPRWAMFGVAEGLSVVTAMFRVLAGAHSKTDVLAAWVLGHATGTLVA